MENIRHHFFFLVYNVYICWFIMFQGTNHLLMQIILGRNGEGVPKELHFFNSKTFSFGHHRLLNLGFVLKCYDCDFRVYCWSHGIQTKTRHNCSNTRTYTKSRPTLLIPRSGSVGGGRRGGDTYLIGHINYICGRLHDKLSRGDRV